MSDTCEVQTLIQIARGFWKRGDLKAAVVELHRALEIEPDNVEALFGLGTVRVARGEFAAAAVSLERAISLQPDTPAMHFALAGALASAGNRSQARDGYRRVLKMNDRDLAAAARERLSRLGREPAVPNASLVQSHAEG